MRYLFHAFCKLFCGNIFYFVPLVLRVELHSISVCKFLKKCTKNRKICTDSYFCIKTIYFISFLLRRDMFKCEKVTFYSLCNDERIDYLR